MSPPSSFSVWRRRCAPKLGKRGWFPYSQPLPPATCPSPQTSNPRTQTPNPNHEPEDRRFPITRHAPCFQLHLPRLSRTCPKLHRFCTVSAPFWRGCLRGHCGAMGCIGWCSFRCSSCKQLVSRITFVKSQPSVSIREIHGRLALL